MSPQCRNTLAVWQKSTLHSFQTYSTAAAAAAAVSTALQPANKIITLGIITDYKNSFFRHTVYRNHLHCFICSLLAQVMDTHVAITFLQSYHYFVSLVLSCVSS